MDEEKLVQVINKIAAGKKGPAEFTATMPSLLSFMSDEDRRAMSYDPTEIVVDATYEEKPLSLLYGKCY